VETFQAHFDRLAKSAVTFGQSSASERLDRIHSIYEAMYAHRDEVGDAGVKEVGIDGRGSLMPFAAIIADLQENLADWMKPTPVAEAWGLEGRAGYIRWEPKGVVLHLSTWNSPFLISFHPLMSMVAAGNTVLLKPSEVAPVSAEVISRIVEASGQTDIVEVVQGGPDVGSALLDLPFNHITYVGSNKVGRIVMEKAARHFAGVTLEMGGKNPVFLTENADVDEAVRRIVNGRLIINGQTCLCPDYVLAHESVYETVVERFRETVAEFYNPDGAGYPLSPALGRVINEGHTRRLQHLIADAVQKGAHVEVGGDVDVAERFIPPTVLTGVDDTMEIFAEEIFGPVITLQPYRTLSEAVTEVEKRPKPLGLYVFSQSREDVDWIVAHTRAGSSAINNIATQATIATLPFGGVNHSGTGRENGVQAFREYSNGRGVVEDALDPAQRTPAFFPPYPEGVDVVQIVDQMLQPSLRPQSATAQA
jgi:aldehyde dehydrogenase (NAD+)